MNTAVRDSLRRGGIAALGIAAVLVVGVFAGGWRGATPALAVAPANDNLADALEIALQPYTNVQSTVDATTEGGSGETLGYTGCQGDYATPSTGATVWYKYTHVELSETLQLDTLGGQTDAVIAVYTYTPNGSVTYDDLSYTAGNCGDWDTSLGGPTFVDAGMTFTAMPLTIYYIQLGGFSGTSGLQVLNLDTWSVPAGSPLQSTQLRTPATPTQRQRVSATMDSAPARYGRPFKRPTPTLAPTTSGSRDLVR